MLPTLQSVVGQQLMLQPERQAIGVAGLLGWIRSSLHKAAYLLLEVMYARIRGSSVTSRGQPERTRI